MAHGRVVHMAALYTLLPIVGSLQLRAAARGRHAPLRMDGGALLRVVHGVVDVEAVANFYTAGLGLSSSTLPDGHVLLGDVKGLRLELCTDADGAYEPKGGYRGLSLRVPDVAAALVAASASGGSVLSEPGTIVHGPSQTPEEPDSMDNEIVEAIVADPAGYPVLLHEAEGCTTAAFSGARCDCHEWKASQEWWESLGWSTVRWQSNVHREASLTVTLAAAAPTEPVGPRGATEPVLQLTYQYSCAPIVPQPSGGLGALVLAAADNAAAATADPDGYAVRFE